MTNPDIAFLQETKERLFEKGWQKGALGDLDGPNCLMGALTFSSRKYWMISSTVIGRVLDELTLVTDGIVTFNDRAETTFDDIIDLLDFAIKHLENE